MASLGKFKSSGIHYATVGNPNTCELIAVYPITGFIKAQCATEAISFMSIVNPNEFTF